MADTLSETEIVKNIFGNGDENAGIIEDAFDVRIVLRDGGPVAVSKNEGREAEEGLQDDSEAVAKAQNVLDRLREIAESGDRVTRQMTAYFCDLVSEGGENAVKTYSADVICTTAHGRPLKAKTNGQREYVNAIKKDSVVFAIGPAGTGKTYLAVAMAVNAFRNNEVSRIILTRPAVEAGEKLGFLPGDLQNKVDPYLRPLYDALYDIMGADVYMRNFEKGAIEIAPLAYMRGRTLDDAFIILDEAQNTTHEQLKMFLTRLGNGSKAVITGDITQIDLPPDKKSGLRQIQYILKNIEGISFVYLTERDVVRHDLVQKIIKAYEKYEEKREERREERKREKWQEK
jgi:phosphate starvation-inducible PhoH-like protein